MSHPLKDKSFVALTASQCLGAFNDNVYRQFIFLVAATVSITWLPKWLDGQSVALACFAAPFVIFALLAGSIADRYSKRTVIVAMNVAEVIAMVLGTVAFALHHFLPDSIALDASIIASMVVLFLMGTQSAFFGPSKYGAIPELVPEEQLTRANGIVSMSVNLGIVFGAVVAGHLLELVRSEDVPTYYTGAFFITVAVIGWAISLFIRKLPPADPDRKLETNLLTVPGHAAREAKYLSKDRDLFAAVLAEGWFYLVGAVALPVLITFAKDQLGTGAEGGSILFAFVGAGIGLGSLLAALLSRGRLELGLMLWGGFGMAAGFFSLCYVETETAAKVSALVAGTFGGLFIVPIMTFIQQRPSAEEKGRVLGAAELSTFLFIFAAAVVHAALNVACAELAEPLGTTAPRLLVGSLGLLMVVGMIGLTLYAPVFLHRAILVAIGTFVYRIRVHGEENLPRHGGAILVPNHISYVDPFLVAYGASRIPRFIMHRWFLRVPLVGWFTKSMNVIPISAEDGPRAMVRALQEAAEHAAEGHLVCIFPEGSISRTGNLLPFQKGIERIAEKANVPIVPVYLDRVWGSLFSFNKRKFFWKKPRGIPYRTSVHFGEPLPPKTPVDRVRRAIQELSADALDRRKGQGETLATRFLRYARRYPRRFAMADSSGKVMSYRKMLISVLVMRRLLRDRVAGEERVGVLLPSGNAGALVNLALAVLGKTSVNLNFTAGKESFESAIEQCGLKTIITSPRFLSKIDMAADPRHLHLEDLLVEATTGVKLKATLLSLLPSFVLQRLPGVPRDPDADVTIIFSSGSTGQPKGVRLTHHNILSNVRSLAQVFDPVATDRILGVLPFFHSFGYTATVWLPFLTGFGAVYHVNPSDSKVIAELIRDHRATIMISTPTFYGTYLRRFSAEDLASIRLAVSGAEKLKSSLREQWNEKFGKEIFEGYGCTELSPGVSVNLPDVEDGDVKHTGHRPGTIGHPLPGVAVKVVDPETEADLPCGEAGMLWVKGPNVMAGYLGNEEATAKVFRDGWYVTGDVASLDRDGFISITGRLARFAKIGGEMVPHLKVEETVQQLVDRRQPQAAEARDGGDGPEVAVTSVPDERRGERLVVLLSKVDAPIEELHDELQATDLPKLWIPRRDAFFQVESLPKLGSGKLDLQAVSRLAADRCPQ